MWYGLSCLFSSFDIKKLSKSVDFSLCLCAGEIHCEKELILYETCCKLVLFCYGLSCLLSLFNVKKYNCATDCLVFSTHLILKSWLNLLIFRCAYARGKSIARKSSFYMKFHCLFSTFSENPWVGSSFVVKIVHVCR